VQFKLDTDQGPLRSGFTFELENGYNVLVGANSSGKSAILQFLARQFYFRDSDSMDRVCYIPLDRMYVQETAQPEDQTFANFNYQLFRASSRNLNFPYNTPTNAWSELPRLLLDHSDLHGQIGRLNELLAELGLPRMDIRVGQRVWFKDVQVAFEGSGLRSALAVLAALTDSRLLAILVDEPELSLQPNLQKKLRSLLHRAAENRLVVVTTHSHLFLNRAEPDRNFVVTQRDGSTTVRRVDSYGELFEITFEQLGSSLDDLFFPTELPNCGGCI
jgi:ABC-type transport system involved in cytochrome bd biosynthesis fused ATPase/permease subunit